MNDLEERFIDVCQQHRANLWFIAGALFVTLTSAVILVLSVPEIMKSADAIVGSVGLLGASLIGARFASKLWQENEELGREAHELAEKLRIEI